MKFFKLGSQITQTVKNVGRLRTIISVMGKHGFATLAEKMSLGRLVPFTIKEKIKIIPKTEKLSIPERLRLAFEELGVTFIKLGQLLSVRPDLVPQEFVEEFKKLQDNVPPLKYETIKKVIEDELGAPLSMVFNSFHEKASAAASIGQVHEAKLKDGTLVVVKVQRPGLKKIIETDISLLDLLATLLDKYVPEIKVFNPKGIVNEFAKNLRREIDFNIEANNIQRFAKNFKENEHLVIPKIYRDFCTNKVLTLEKIEGTNLSALLSEEPPKIDLKKIVRYGIHGFYQQVLEDGLFHGDPHAGNLIVVNEEKLALVDFGIVGHLSQKTRDSLSNLFIALLSEDYESVVYEFLDLGPYPGKINTEGFTKDVKDAIEPYLGAALKNIDIGKLLTDLTITASKHNIQVSQDVMLLAKALITIESLGRRIDPDFEILEEMSVFIKTILKNRYRPQRLTKDLLWLAKDINSLLQVLPRQLKQILRKIANDDFIHKIEIIELKQLKEEIARGKNLQSLSLLIASLLIGTAIVIASGKGMIVFGLPILSIGGLALAGILTLGYLVSFFRKR